MDVHEPMQSLTASVYSWVSPVPSFKMLHSVDSRQPCRLSCALSVQVLTVLTDWFCLELFRVNQLEPLCILSTAKQASKPSFHSSTPAVLLIQSAVVKKAPCQGMTMHPVNILARDRSPACSGQQVQNDCTVLAVIWYLDQKKKYLQSDELGTKYKKNKELHDVTHLCAP